MAGPTRYFNPRTSCEVRPKFNYRSHPAYQISIHAPRVRCDNIVFCKRYFKHNFNPRTSCEVRPDVVFRKRYFKHNFNPRTSCEVRRTNNLSAILPLTISIHAPRVRCDRSKNGNTRQSDYFNPRTSCEVRPSHRRTYPKNTEDFNPRTSCEVRPRYYIPML